MKRLISRKIEAWLILLAANILIERNFQRCAVASRRDNNAIWAMTEQLQATAKRISKKYPNHNPHTCLTVIRPLPIPSQPTYHH